TEVPQTFNVSVSGLPDIRILTNTSVTVESGENRSLPTVVDVPPESINQSNNEIRFRAQSETDASLVVETESRFVGPTR
ncbi:MAG: FixG Ig-like domain-containing protein, partial [Pseudomonadota bacterium]|nr:FixG Ig-like domain-containing protein [Pseudomonadota bacterium]